MGVPPTLPLYPSPARPRCPQSRLLPSLPRSVEEHRPPLRLLRGEQETFPLLPALRLGSLADPSAVHSSLLPPPPSPSLPRKQWLVLRPWGCVQRRHILLDPRACGIPVLARHSTALAMPPGELHPTSSFSDSVLLLYSHSPTPRAISLSPSPVATQFRASASRRESTAAARFVTSTPG